jgi:hypothetical protein
LTTGGVAGDNRLMMLAQGDRWGLRGLGALLITALTTACPGNGGETASDSSTGDQTTTETTGGSTGTTDVTPTTSTTATSTTETTETTGTTADETSGTTDDPTGGGGGECFPQQQDCPEGQKCTAYEKDLGGNPGWDANQCVDEVPNAGQVGDPCEIAEGESVFSGLDNCAAGYFCFNFDFMTGKGGECIEFCKPDNTCPETNGGNAGCVEGANMGVLPICLGKCDPLTQDCPDMQGCYGDAMSLDFFICATPDTGMGTGTDNEPCTFTNACAPGFHCADAAVVEGCAGEVGCCTPFCEIGDESGCAASEDCVPFYANDPPPGTETVGVCAIPQ